MPKNELQKIFDNTPAESYKDKVKQIEDYFVSIADGDNIIGTGKEIIYPEHLWKYKHSFADGIYIREMRMKKGQLGFSAIHKHSYGFFLLSGTLASSKEDGVITTVHANPTNTEDLDELAKINVVFNWDEYEEYLKENKL
jgi:hypothetical protein